MISVPDPAAAVAYIANGDVSLALERRGRGPSTLLFVHGWISSRRMWYDVVDRLDPARFTSYLLDFRGSGLSDRPSDGHDLAGYASDLRSALAEIPAEVTLIGHSMGGKISQFIATEAPAALARLVLVAPGSPRAIELNEKHRALAVDAFGSRRRIEQFQRAAMARPLSESAMERIVSDALLAQREAWFGWYDHGRTADFAERLPSIRVPTYVLAADRDLLAPPARVRREIVAPIAGAVLVVLRGVGHNIPVEVPADVATLIDRVG